jgi:Uncharacterized protein conserved in bacteria (DUF2333)
MASDSFDEGKSRGILWIFGILVLLTLAVLIFLGAWWGSEPEQFSIQDEALERAKITKTFRLYLYQCVGAYRRGLVA